MLVQQIKLLHFKSALVCFLLSGYIVKLFLNLWIVFYPHNYGFIPQTLCKDGDALDVLVLGELCFAVIVKLVYKSIGEECVPGSIVDIRPLGYMIMEDEKGLWLHLCFYSVSKANLGLDEKVLAVPTHDPRFAEYRSLRDVPEHLLREIAHFFDTYKALEKKKWYVFANNRGLWSDFSTN